VPHTPDLAWQNYGILPHFCKASVVSLIAHQDGAASSFTGKKPGWWGALFAGGDDGEIGDLGERDGDRIMAAGHGQPDLPAVS
jgi:hypothetical protein